MVKGLVWIGIVAVGVFIGVFAYDRYQGYKAAKEIEHFTRIMLEAEARERKNLRAKQQQTVVWQQSLIAERETEKRRRLQLELDENTLCAMNTDADKCVCIHRETGQKIVIAKSECVIRASKATDSIR